MTATAPPASWVHLRVLGSLTAIVQGRPVAVGGPGARAVIARLAAAAGRVVSTDLLIDDLWAGQPPPKALAALQVHVSNLRRVLEPARAPRTPSSVIVSAPPGYALRLPPESVDAWHFERLVVEVPAVGLVEPFPLDATTQHRFVEGLDDIGLTLSHADEIDAFEGARPAWLTASR